MFIHLITSFNLITVFKIKIGSVAQQTNSCNRLEVFYKIDFLENFKKYIRKHLCRSLFLTAAAL